MELPQTGLTANVASLLVRRRQLCFTFVVAVLVFFGYGFRYLHIDTDYKSMFSTTNPQRVQFESIQETYGMGDNLILLVVPKNGNVFEPATLQTILNLTEKAWGLPFSSRVDSISNFLDITATDDTIYVDEVVKKDSDISALNMGELRKKILSQSELVNSLVDAKGSVSLINVTLNMPGHSDEHVNAVVSAAKQLIEQSVSKNAPLDIYLQGTIAGNYAFSESSKRDASTLIPLMFVVITVFLWWSFRSVGATVITLTVVTLSTCVAVGFAGWMGVAINQLNVTAPTIIMTLAVCDSVHIIAHFIERLREDEQPERAMEACLRKNLLPIFLTNFTTIVGFACVNATDSPPLAELSNMTAVGMAAAFMLTFMATPLLALKYVKRPTSAAASGERVVSWFSSVGVKHRDLIFWSVVVLTFALGVAATRNEFDDNAIKYFSKKDAIRQAGDMLQDKGIGLDMAMYSLRAPQGKTINEADILRKADAFASWLREQPEVTHVYSVTDLIKRISKTMNGNDERYYAIPDTRELAAQYLLMYEMSLSFGQDIENLVSFDRSSLLVSCRVKVDKSKSLIALDERAQAWLTRNAPELKTSGASASLMFAYLGKNNMSNMVLGDLLTVLIIFIVISAGFRSLKYGTLSMLPNISPALFALGMWGLLDGTINIGVIVVYSITFGIVVDDTIHFMTHYIRARREDGLDAELAVERAVRLSGKSLSISTFVLAGGFLVLALSDFKVNATMGLMTGATIIIALFFDLLVLPAILVKFDKPAPAYTLTGVAEEA